MQLPENWPDLSKKGVGSELTGLGPALASPVHTPRVKLLILEQTDPVYMYVCMYVCMYTTKREQIPEFSHVSW